MKFNSLIATTALFWTFSLSAHAALFFVIGDLGTAGGVNNWPGGETPSSAADGSSSSKYINFGKTNTGYIFTPASTENIVTGINFTTANDAVERDPASYILWGSNTSFASMTAGVVFDVENFFTKISEGVLTLPNDRLTSGGNVTFTNTVAYNTYLLVFPTVKNTAGANSMQIAEARLQVANGGPIGTEGIFGGGQLSSVPEPGSLAMLALAGTALLGIRSRKKA